MNKALLTLLFVISLSILTMAQSNFTIEPVPAYATANLQNPASNPGDVVAHAVVKNNTSNTLKLSWVRFEKIMPEGWATGICDLNYCYDTDISRRDFELPPNGSGILDVHAYPGGIPGSLENGAIPGEARVNIRVTNRDDVTDTLSGIYIFNVGGEPIVTGIKEIQAKNLSLFPNPANDYFELSADKNNIVNTVAIYNILGRQVGLFEANELRFDIGHLPKGMYLVSLMDKQNAILKTLRLQKR